MVNRTASSVIASVASAVMATAYVGALALRDDLRIRRSGVIGLVAAGFQHVARGKLLVPAELQAHRREHLVGDAGVAARAVGCK